MFYCDFDPGSGWKSVRLGHAGEPVSLARGNAAARFREKRFDWYQEEVRKIVSGIDPLPRTDP